MLPELLEGFIVNKTSFFKLGSAKGSRVMSTNSTVQGCSLSILMVNSLYSVLSDAVSQNSPQVSLVFVHRCLQSVGFCQVRVPTC